MSAEVYKIRILLERGKYKEAEALIRPGLAAEPNDADLHLLLARSLFHQDKPKEAEASARAAIGLIPDEGYPYQALAQVLLGSSNLKGAEEAVRQATALDGDSPNCRGLLARIAAERDKFEVCLEHAKAGLEMDPDDDLCRYFRGIALSRLGRHEEADEEARGLLRDDPEDSYNHSCRGWVLLERNAIDEAKLHFQEALRLDPENENARSGLVRAMQQGNPVLGWMLRAALWFGELSLPKMILVGLLVVNVIPALLKGDHIPLAVEIAGKVFKTGFMAFVFTLVAASPLFNALLFFSRDGRRALGPYETRAVKWSVGPLLAGVVLLVMWVAGGGKSLPLAAIGMFCTSSLFFDGFSVRHPWVRRRMVMVAFLGFAFALWLLLGPTFLLGPKIAEFTAGLKDLGKPAADAEIKQRLMAVIELKNRAFVYPCLVFYLATSFVQHLIAALERRAPDESD
ncbi:MAG: tetratricopeptide repeat protein [Akkermansiaceae bacterium]|nr:tetratricopeptide repeat protein [Akkermansiaceae bacterium]